VLELAVLGLLHETPMHGYELRKQLHETLGSFRTLSWGTVYPTLRRLLNRGLIEESPQHGHTWNRRTKRVYQITTAGRERFTELVTDCQPQSCDDKTFGVHVAFFSRTPAETRLRILENRRRRVEERRERIRALLTRAGDRLDRYILELNRLRLKHSEQEVRWLNEFIEHERAQLPTGADAQPNASGR